MRDEPASAKAGLIDWLIAPSDDPVRLGDVPELAGQGKAVFVKLEIEEDVLVAVLRPSVVPNHSRETPNYGIRSSVPVQGRGTGSHRDGRYAGEDGEFWGSEG